MENPNDANAIRNDCPPSSLALLTVWSLSWKALITVTEAVSESRWHNQTAHVHVTVEQMLLLCHTENVCFCQLNKINVNSQILVSTYLEKRFVNHTFFYQLHTSPYVICTTCCPLTEMRHLWLVELNFVSLRPWLWGDSTVWIRHTWYVRKSSFFLSHTPVLIISSFQLGRTVIFYH